jgi:hypothetical protein
MGWVTPSGATRYVGAGGRGEKVGGVAVVKLVREVKEVQGHVVRLLLAAKQKSFEYKLLAVATEILWVGFHSSTGREGRCLACDV